MPPHLCMRWSSSAAAYSPASSINLRNLHGGRRRQGRPQVRCAAAPGPGGADEASSFDSDDGSSLSKLRYNKPRKQELPDALKDLKLTDDGLLIDERTGQVVNEFGATRFDVKVRALRGELDPPAWQPNTEQAAGVMLQALQPWPAEYTFQVVGRPAPDRQGFIDDMVALVAGACEVADMPEGAVEVKERLGGKYLSLAVRVTVRAPELVTLVYERLAKDERVVMRF